MADDIPAPVGSPERARPPGAPDPGTGISNDPQQRGTRGPDGTAPGLATGGGATGGGATGGGSTGGGSTGGGATGDGATGGGGAEDGATGDGATGDGSTGDGATGDGATGGGRHQVGSDPTAAGPTTGPYPAGEPTAGSAVPASPWSRGGSAVPGPGEHGPPGADQPTGPLSIVGPKPRGRPLASVLAFALVMALLGGVVGGFVGLSLGRGGVSTGVLGQPLPGIEDGAAVGPVEAVAARVLPSVVQLRVRGSGRQGEGSGMVLSADGLVLTNNHVIEAAAEQGEILAVFDDGRSAPAEIVGRDPNSDLAVIRARDVTGLTPVELGNSDTVRVGQQVVAFGAPLGLGGTVTAGIVSAIDRAVSVGGERGANAPTVLNALQTDAAINPGNSGGPLVDMQGRIIGVNSAIATTGGPQGGSIGVGFAIPINQATRVAEELQRTGQAQRALLGVTLRDDPDDPVGGATVASVVPGGAAERAGIRAGDVVIRFDDQRIATAVDLQAAVGSRAPGSTVEVELFDRTVQVTLAADG